MLIGSPSFLIIFSLLQVRFFDHVIVLVLISFRFSGRNCCRDVVALQHAWRLVLYWSRGHLPLFAIESPSRKNSDQYTGQLDESQGRTGLTYERGNYLVNHLLT